MRLWSAARCPTAVLLGLVTAASWGGPAQAAPTAPLGAWSVQLSAPLVQAAQAGAMTLAPDADGLWLATENSVTRYRRGLWEQPQQPPSAAGIFALVPTSSEVWAFGYEGGVWRRAAGTWSMLASPTKADLYAGASRDANEVWAAGFDYEAEQGMLLRVDGSGMHAVTRPWLGRIQLHSLAASPSGELWAGGCSYSDAPFLMRDGGHGDWQPVTPPLAIGCVFHLSFASSGFGLAAAGTDLLTWDGQAWQASGQPPPAGLQWMRVAAMPGGGSSALRPAAAGTGWAIPAEPNWRGYVRGDPPWSFDGVTWEPGSVDYGPYAAAFDGGSGANVRPFVALASAAGVAWTVSLGATGTDESQSVTALLRLDALAGRVAHPFVTAAGDVAAWPDGPVWVAGTGATPMVGTGPGADWGAGVTSANEGGPAFAFVDLAGPTAGWALARAADEPFGELTPWRWDGGSWQAAPPPGDWSIRRLRAWPDGRAWAIADEGLLLEWAAGVWAPVPGAPTVPAPPTSDILPGARPATPFDVAIEGGRRLACVATPAGLYRYIDGGFGLVSMPARSPQYVDLQLTGGGTGWALPVERSGLELLAGQVARLANCQPQLLRVDPLGPGVAAGPFQLMAALDADTVFLYGGAAPPRGRSQLLGYRPSAGVFFEHEGACPALGLSAVPAAGGVDLWLAGGPWPASGAGACGPVTAQTPPPWTGLLGRLVLRPARDQVWLPLLGRW